MEPATEAQRRTLDLVHECLREAFGPLLAEGERTPAFLVPGGPHGIRVAVQPVGEDEAVVDVFTWVGRDVEVTSEVARWLLERNAALRFVSLALDADGDVRIDAALFPENVSADELARVVALVAAAADDVDRELSERFR